jgi:hypothetical protein
VTAYLGTDADDALGTLRTLRTDLSRRGLVPVTVERFS